MEPKERKNIERMSLRLPRFQITAMLYCRITDWSNALPIRTSWRIFWNPEPGASIAARGIPYPLLPDRLLLVPPHLPVRHHLYQPTRSLALHVELEALTQPTVDAPAYPELSDDMIDRLQEIPKAYPDGIAFSTGDGNDPRMVWMLRELVCRSFQYLPPEIWLASRKDSRIEEAMQTLHQRRSKGCTNEELAEQASLATNSFVRLFKKEVGLPPHTYLQNLRLDHAARLLHTSRLSIDQVAETCGFCDRNYLSKLFRRRFHTGPAQYRKQEYTAVI